MMRWLIRSSMSFRLLLLAAAAAIAVVGVAQLRNTPVDVLPEYAPPTVEIQTEALGLSAAEVEQLITVPMEQDLLAGIAFLDDLRSESVPGLSRIFLVFEPGTDLFRARQVVAERLTQAHALPNVSKPPQMLQPLSSTNRVMMIEASSPKLSPIAMSVLARWTIAPQLIGVEGVANVSVWGFRDRQLQVQVDPERLRASDVSLDRIIESTGNALWFSPLTFVEASTPGTGGFIDTPNQRLGVQHLSTINSAADLAKVRVADTGSRQLVLGDVARVVEDHQPLIGDALSGDGSHGPLFVVEKLPGANTLQVTRGLEAAVAAMQPGLPNVVFETGVYRPASYIDKAIDNVGIGLTIGALLAALALSALFFRWQAVACCVVVVPLSLLAAALVLDQFDTSINAMIVAGFAAALVLVIDDAVAGVDAISQRVRERGRDGTGTPVARAILEATLDVRSVTAYGTLIVALALLPLFFMRDLAGAFFPDVAGAFVLALLASMLVALTVTPALATLLFSRSSVARESPLAAGLRRACGRALGWVAPRPGRALLAVGGATVAAALAVPFLSVSLLPSFKEQQLLVRWDAPAGTSLSEMNRITTLASRELRTIEGVKTVGVHAGRAVGSDLSANSNSAELWVSIDPTADYGATAATIRSVVAGYPGLSRDIGVFSDQRARAILTGGQTKDVVIRVYGEDRNVLSGQAERVRLAVSNIAGIGEPRVLRQSVQPTVEVEVDLAAARAAGIKPGDVRRATATLLGGLVVGNLFEQQKVFEVVVWGTPATRSSLTSIRRLLVETPDGRRIRLGEVADVRIAPNETVIQRHAISRYIDVRSTVHGRDRDAVARDVQRQLAAMTFPLEYHVEVTAPGGQPVSRLVALGLGAAAMILLLFQAFLGSWRLAALCLVTLPLAVSGGLVAAVIDGGTLSFGSVIALFAVFGLAVRNAMQLVDRIRRLRQAGARLDADVVVNGARDRAVPIVGTALVASLALMPFVVMGDIVGYELVHPVAVVVLGGLVTSTWLTLFVVPALYLLVRPTAVPESSPAAAGLAHSTFEPAHTPEAER